MLTTTEGKRVKLVTYVAVFRGRQVALVKYRTAPNPGREGWWLPAPELDHGEDPADRATVVLRSLGLAGAEPSLVGVESFTTRDWHVLFLYRATADRELTPGSEYDAVEWFDLDALPAAAEFAHGEWERSLVARLAP